MKQHTLLGGLICGIVLVLLAGTAMAQAPAGAGDEPPAGAADQPPAGPSDDQIRNAVQQANRLTAFHKKLQPIKGTYKQTVKWWRAPGAEPTEFETRSAAEWILEKRFVKQTFHGRWLEVTFEGNLLLGYDSIAQKYTAVWIDSLSTRMLMFQGASAEDESSVTLHGEYLDLTSGQPVKVRITMEVPNKKGETKLEMYRTTSDGVEYKFLEIASERFVARGA